MLVRIDRACSQRSARVLVVPELTVRDRAIGSQHANTLEAAAGFSQRVLAHV